MSPSIVNNRLTLVVIYIPDGDAQHAVAKCKSRVWGKVPEGSTLIFRDTLIPLKHSVDVKGSPHAKKLPRSKQMLRYNTNM